MKCTGKSRYTEDHARSVARRERRNGRTLHRYQCRICGGWHLTSHARPKVVQRGDPLAQWMDELLEDVRVSSAES